MVARIVLAVLLWGVLAAAPGQAGELVAPAGDAAAQKFVRDCDSLREGKIAALEFRLRGIRSGAVRVTHRERSLQVLQRQLAALESHRAIVVPTLRWPLEKSAIGGAPSAGAHIEKILGPSEMLVTLFFSELAPQSRKGRVVAEKVNLPTVVLLRGLPTSDLTPGMDMPLTEILEVVGESSYENHAGKSLKASVLSPLDLQRIGAKPKAEVRR